MANDKTAEERAALDQAIALLADEGVSVTDEMAEALCRHAALVQEWNRIVSVVSTGDEERVLSRHIVDSLSLAASVLRACGDGGTLLDIGTGGGFPAIPLKIVLPDLALVLAERSVKKVGFLRKVIGALKLKGVAVVTEPFPRGAAGLSPQAITARAVEKPDRVMQDVLDFLPMGSVFVCQLATVDDMVPEMFHVEHIEDEWTGAGLRRGSLRLISPCS